MKKETWKRVAPMAAGALLLIVIAATLVILPLRTGGVAATPITNDGEAESADRSEGAEDRMTILLAGTDRASGLADVMMLVTLEKRSGKVTILQLPRDTYVNCGAGSYRKLNGVPSALGGMAQAREFLAKSLGVEIHRYLRLSPNAFREIVDALGGVEITLPSALTYDDPAQGLSIRLPAGKQTLNGEAAEQFVRFRADYVRGDLGRMDAQKIFLAALLDKVRNELSPLTVAKLGMAMLGKVETDLSLADVTALAADAGNIPTESVSFVTAPGADVTATTGASFYVLSAPAMDELLAVRFGGQAGGFDREKAFLYARSENFAEIYRRFESYTVFSATEIRQGDLGIATKD